MKYESSILKRLIDTYGVIGNPRYISEIIKEFIVRGKECYPDLFTYQSDWLAHIDEFGLTPEYTVSYTGQQIYAPNTKERPVKRAILKGSTKYRDIDTGEFLETFEEGRNLELVSVKMPVLTTTGKNLFDGKFETYSGPYGFYEFDFTNDVYTYSITDNDTSVDISTLSLGDMDENNKITWIFDEGRYYYTSRTITSGKLLYYPNTEEAFNKIKQRYHIQIEEGTVATEYEPYKTNILTTSEEVELRGVGNIKDELNLLTGELTQRIGEIVLDGNEDWTINSEFENTIRFRSLTPFSNHINTFDGGLICNNFESKDLGRDNRGVQIFNNRLYISFNRTELQTLDNNGVKQWLASSPTIINYQLATPTVKTVDLTILDQNGQNVKQLMSFNGGTHFTTSSQEGSLLPTLSVDVVTDLEETLKVCSLEGNTM